MQQYRGRHASGSSPAKASVRAARGSSPSHASHASHASHSFRFSFGSFASCSRGTNVGLGIAGFLVILLAFSLIFGAWYIHALNKALSFDGGDYSAVESVTEDVDLSQPFYMLVLGSDSREGSGTSNYAPNTGDNERSDVMILLRVDASQKQITMVSIPRDTPYTFEDGKVDKINETYNRGGAAETIEAVEKVTGVDIAHFAEVRFSDLEGMVDALGGVTVNVDTPLSYKDALTGEWVEIPEGEQVLTGQQAQIFARARHEYESDQDMHRQQNVRQLATAMLHSVLEKPFFKIPFTVLNLAEYIGTDLRAGDFLYLARAFAGSDLTLYSCTGPNAGDINPDADDMWLCYENPEGWAELMKAVDNGKDPSGIDVNASANIPASQDESEDESQYSSEGNPFEGYAYSEDSSYYGYDSSVDGTTYYDQATSSEYLGEYPSYDEGYAGETSTSG